MHYTKNRLLDPSQISYLMLLKSNNELTWLLIKYCCPLFQRDEMPGMIKYLHY